MQERVKRTGSDDKTEEAVPVDTDTSTGARIKSDLDDLLDDIDQVLEENAEEFVRNYVQKGGQ